MRKRNLLVLFCIVMINVSYGQFETGKRMIGGGTSFNTGTNDFQSSPVSSQRNTSFLFNVSVSKFASPLLVKGIGIHYGHTYSHSNIDNPSVDRVDYSHLVGVFINRTKLQPIGKKLSLAFTGSLSAAYGFGKSSYTHSVNYTDSKSYIASMGGAMGIWYHLNQRFILTGDFNNLISVNYSYSTYTTTNGTAVNSGENSDFGISSGLSGIPLNSLQIGLRYILK